MTNYNKKLDISKEEREVLITKLVDELPVLRTKLGVSQADLAALIDISRQTYSLIEAKKRKLSWSIFLSLILVFDNNVQTHDLIRKQKLFPKGIIMDAEPDKSTLASQISTFVQMDGDAITNHLDEQAFHAIETVIMVEYARCNNIAGDTVIKSFDGKRFTQVTEKDIKARRALEHIKSRNGKETK